jgi:hypothetical protein
VFDFDFKFRGDRDDVIRAIDFHRQIVIQFRKYQRENISSQPFDPYSKQSSAIRDSVVT